MFGGGRRAEGRGKTEKVAIPSISVSLEHFDAELAFKQETSSESMTSDLGEDDPEKASRNETYPPGHFLDSLYQRVFEEISILR